MYEAISSIKRNQTTNTGGKQIKHKKIKIELARIYWIKGEKQKEKRKHNLYQQHNNNKGRSTQSSDIVTNTIKKVNST